MFKNYSWEIKPITQRYSLTDKPCKPTSRWHACSNVHLLLAGWINNSHCFKMNTFSVHPAPLPKYANIPQLFNIFSVFKIFLQIWVILLAKPYYHQIMRPRSYRVKQEYASLTLWSKNYDPKKMRWFEKCLSNWKILADLKHASWLYTLFWKIVCSLKNICLFERKLCWPNTTIIKLNSLDRNFLQVNWHFHQYFNFKILVSYHLAPNQMV